jgi:hypothetical protein
MPTIAIESILGGQGPTTHFGGKGSFRASLGIDPAQPIDDLDTAYSTMASGLLRPSASQKISSTTITSAPLWLVPNPKDANVYVYDANGSAYTVDATMTTVTALSDGGTLTSSIGNGAEYYDNYIYFAKNTDVARYGPLNGVPVFNGTYWTGTLAKAALTNTTYPKSFLNSLGIPNHVMKRHSDGKLYVADVVGNQGTLHVISTTKTTVEGDTDSSSTASKLTLGYGLWPTAIETFGSDLAFAVYEGSNSNLRQTRAKVGFWDTTSTNFSSIIWCEFPDSIITALKNRNGTLFAISGNYNARGFRISKYVGGYSFQEVYYSETGEPCLPGAIDAILDRILVGSFTTIPESDGCVYSSGLQKANLSSGLFNTMRATGGNSSTSVTSLCVADNTELGFMAPIIGWTQAGEGSTGVSHGIDVQKTQYNNAPSVFWSTPNRIGAFFKITSIRIPFAQKLAANMTLIPKIYTDSGNGTTYTLPTINNTNYGTQNYVFQKLENVTGRNDFWLELRWTGSALLTVSLPIIITYEVTSE